MISLDNEYKQNNKKKCLIMKNKFKRIFEIS